jgi:RHS repeat-associated protein
VASQFLYDGNDIAAEIGGGAVGANYLRSLNIDEPFIRQTGTGNEFYHTDALGSSLALSNAQGSSATTYTYEPFGKTTVSGASSNTFQYTGRENDGTGLAYYRARYYASSLSRFLNEDPMYSPLYNAKTCRGSFTPRVSRYVEADPGLSMLMAFRFYNVAGAFAVNVQKLHLYAYADDNPVNRTDPLGLIAAPQVLGCDVVGGHGGFFDSPCAKKCCNAHDRCYSEATDFCDASTWIAKYPPRPQCDACNAAVLGCLADAFKGYLSGRKGCS